MEDLRSIVKNR